MIQDYDGGPVLPDPASLWESLESDEFVVGRLHNGPYSGANVIVESFAADIVVCNSLGDLYYVPFYDGDWWIGS